MSTAALDTLVTVRMLKLLATPIEKSEAFKKGIIDRNAKKLREPAPSEKNSYTFLNRFVFRIQRALTRSSDMQARRLLSFAAAMALLREYKEEDDDMEVASLLELYMQDEDVIQNAKLLEKNVLGFRQFNEMMGVGGGAIAGIGVGPQGDPGVDPRLMPMARRKKRKKKNGDC